jgi:hypothetical protein
MFRTNRSFTVLHKTKQALSNPPLLVFYSKQYYVTLYGNATNWNSTGFWEETYPQSCKFTVNV